MYIAGRCRTRQKVSLHTSAHSRLSSYIRSQPPKIQKIALWPSTNLSIADIFTGSGTCQLPTFSQVVDQQLLRLLSTDILVHKRLAVNQNIKVSIIFCSIGCYHWTHFYYTCVRPHCDFSHLWAEVLWIK